ncbi:MAG: response regulator transcription factor [Bacillota bacterium]
MAKKILIADDSDALRALLQATLRDPRYEIIQASGGVQALALREMHKPDLVILDETITGISGVDVCRAIKRSPHSSRTPVILMSTKTQEDGQQLVRQAGADVHLTKPFSPLSLLGTVERLLASKED